MRKLSRTNHAEFNFVWLFAILAGASILILATYGAVKLGDLERFKSDTETAKKISIITEPLQAGFSEGSFGKIIFNQDTRINNICFSSGFGKNEISISTKSGIGKEWIKAGGASSIYNKYIFSKEHGQGEEFYIFSKPFYFPYKVADLIFLIPDSEKYCFLSPPEDIEKEVLGLNIPNIEISRENQCSSDSVKVCFSSYGFCSEEDIEVHGSCYGDCKSVYEEGYIKKQGEEIEYGKSLIYAGIFSDVTVYNCNIKRLMYRTSKIADIFSNKADLMNSRGCNTNLKPDLIFWKGMTINATSSDLISLNQVAKSIDKKEEQELCGIW
jgi:hypothetical protein